MIATYAICGFASFADVGICLGAIGAMAPKRKSKSTPYIDLRLKIYARNIGLDAGMNSFTTVQ